MGRCSVSTNVQVYTTVLTVPWPLPTAACLPVPPSTLPCLRRQHDRTRASVLTSFHLLLQKHKDVLPAAYRARYVREHWHALMVTNTPMVT